MNGKIFNKTISDNQAKDTGMAMVLILLLLGLYFEDFIYLKFAALLLIITMIRPMVFKYVAVVWLGGSNLLGLIVSKIILTLVFFCVVLPVGVFRRLSGKDTLKLQQFKKSTTSVMTDRNLTYLKKHIEKPY